jgi:hypothetical protein
MPSWQARSGLITTRAAAPSLSGQSSALTTCRRTARICVIRGPGPKPVRNSAFRAWLREGGVVVLIGAPDAVDLRHVLGGLTHADVDVRQSALLPRIGPQKVVTTTA